MVVLYAILACTDAKLNLKNGGGVKSGKMRMVF
jgi:hypothetical protein